MSGSAKTAAALVDEIEMHCPCGARPESLGTHPHVGGCPVEKLKRVLTDSFAALAESVRLQCASLVENRECVAGCSEVPELGEGYREHVYGCPKLLAADLRDLNVTGALERACDAARLAEAKWWSTHDRRDQGWERVQRIAELEAKLEGK